MTHMATSIPRYELYGGPLDGEIVDFAERHAVPVDLQLDAFGFIVVASPCVGRWLRYKRVDLAPIPGVPALVLGARPWPYRFDGWVEGPL